MFIGVYQLSRHDSPPKNLYFPSPPDGTRVRPPRAHSPRESLESGLSHLIHIADASVNNCSDATNGPMKIRGYLAPERAEQTRLVKVLHNYNFRTGN
jgi:hypothetical protein